MYFLPWCYNVAHLLGLWSHPASIIFLTNLTEFHLRSQICYIKYVAQVRIWKIKKGQVVFPGYKSIDTKSTDVWTPEERQPNTAPARSRYGWFLDHVWDTVCQSAKLVIMIQPSLANLQRREIYYLIPCVKRSHLQNLRQKNIVLKPMETVSSDGWWVGRRN